MKKIILLTFCLLIFSTNSFAQKKEMTVKDYFLAMPTEFINAEPKKRADWIERVNAEDGTLTYNIPLSELTDEDAGDATVYGEIQVFKKKKGGVLLGIANNICAEGKCSGMINFLDYKNGEFTDVSEKYSVTPDNDEILNILREAPAFEEKESLKDDEQVPLAIEFYGGEKIINFIAGCKKSCDGGIVAKMYKWNGEKFEEFEYVESPI